jgi:CheY-like chemotaxis protein
MVNQNTGDDPVDCSEAQFNEAVLSFCMRVLDEVRQTGPARAQGFGVSPPVVFRSTTALVGTAAAACDTRLFTTERGSITLMSINADAGTNGDEDGPRRSRVAVRPVPQAPPRNPDDPPRILIVDDDPQACRLLATGVRTLGWTADVAHRGQSALGYLERNVADLILLDYDMPGMDGLECLQAIRDLRGPIPVIMITAAKSADVIKRAKALGAVDYIIKPYKIEHVKDRIARALEPATAEVS